ncbi:phosphopentomutase [Candidatus Ruminimicrobiellum ovillum]|uniref:phosphopentomutase n=1 Tax=Candidatus Ruminimicrobiellum ovillum TaxID=1947927 RepID=UPI003559ECB9
MVNINRIILIVLDSVGAGELPDAAKYGDVGTNTLKHIFEQKDENFVLENMGKLGLYNIVPSPYGYNPENIVGCYGKMATLSPAKDTTAGHWELSGIVLDKPFPTYPNGFPKDLIEEFEKQIGTKILGNCVASGTEIIKRLGQEHYKTGYPIVYTSADSVFQIAAAEDGEKFGGLTRLYEICEIARNLLQGEHAVGRVIARPFIRMEDGTLKRTTNRKDYSLTPPQTTVLDKIKNVGGNVVAIGKIKDIFNNKGIVTSYHTVGNPHGIQLTIDSVKDIENTDNKKFNKQLIFTNLVDFDMLWGHRRNVIAYAQALDFFDGKLPEIIRSMKETDLLIITADHGCDPTCTKHTDHTREYVPLMVYGKKIKQNINLGTRKSLSDVAQTIADIFELEPMKNGTSFKNEII